MLDIGKVIGHEELLDHDPDGNLAALDEWSPGSAEEMAAAEGLKLGDDHWRVIRRVRDIYRKHGGDCSATAVLRDLESEFAAEGGRRHLYCLFPQGPVSQASRLGGLPAFPHSRDPSFGSVE